MRAHGQPTALREQGHEVLPSGRAWCLVPGSSSWMISSVKHQVSVKQHNGRKDDNHSAAELQRNRSLRDDDDVMTRRADLLLPGLGRRRSATPRPALAVWGTPAGAWRWGTPAGAWRPPALRVPFHGAGALCFRELIRGSFGLFLSVVRLPRFRSCWEQQSSEASE